MEPAVPQMILFCYPGSVFSRKMEYYLTLCGLPYARCIQPAVMPRSDLTQLGVNYRRIPILAIGRDVYCDSRIIIEKLEQTFTENALGSHSSFEQGLERIFEAWVIDAGPMLRTAGCMPTELPVLQDPIFLKDRHELTAGSFSVEALRKNRRTNLAHLRMYFDTAEKLLSDGRHFLFATSTPSLVDVHAMFCFEWALMLLSLADTTCIPEYDISETSFPAVHAWIERFKEAFHAAELAQPPGLISSEAAIESILSSNMFETDFKIDAKDPLSPFKGQRVTVTPTDYGFTHSDTGDLISLTPREVVIETQVPNDMGVLHLHFPRNNFRIELDT